MIRGPHHPLLERERNDYQTPNSSLTWLIKREPWRAQAPLCTCIYVCTHRCEKGSLSHFISNPFLPNTSCKAEMEAVLLLLWPPSTEASIIVAASCHIHPCGTYCIYPAWIFHEYWGSNCNVRHNAYFRWHMTDVFRDLGLLCTCNIHLLPESWSFLLLHWLKSKKENKCAFWMYLIFYWNNELRYCHVCFPLSFPKDRAQR